MTKSKGCSPYPGDCQGAVSLTFDDGLPSQLDCAVPLLEQYGLSATFYLRPRGADREVRLAAWREVARAGHELGNHTTKHICSRAFADSLAGNSLEDCTLEEMEADIVLGKERIQQLVPDQAEMSFAYPCYSTHVGEGASRQSYVPLVAKHHIAGRDGFLEVANHPLTANLACLSAWNAERCWGATLVGLAERAVTRGRWSVFTFHGIDEAHLAINDVDFEELCRHLQLHSDRIWVAPVAEVARRILDWRCAQ